MAITILPIDRDPATGLPEYTAQQYRQARAAEHGGGSGRQLGLRSGFRVGTPSNVLTATSTTWTLGPCAAKLDVGEGVTQGGYDWANDSNYTGSGAQGVQAADATNPRKDIVYIQVNDANSDGSGQRSAPILYLAGNPGVNPQPPTLPARSFLVGTISVPQVGGGSPTVTLNPARYVAAGGLLPVDQTERDALSTYDTLTVVRRDLPGRPLETFDGSGWRLQGPYAEYVNQAVLNSVVPVNGQLGPFFQSFPAGRFSVPPIITFGVSNARLTAGWNNVTTSGFDLYIRNDSDLDAVSGAIITFEAKQMTATTAAG